jgi:hypothetical protein
VTDDEVRELDIFRNLPRSQRRKTEHAAGFNHRRLGVRVGVTKPTLAARKRKRRSKKK